MSKYNFGSKFDLNVTTGALVVVGRRKMVVLLVATVTLDRLVVVEGSLVVIGLSG